MLNVGDRVHTQGGYVGTITRAFADEALVRLDEPPVSIWYSQSMLRLTDAVEELARLA